MKCTMANFDIIVDEILEEAGMQVVKLTDKAVDEAADLVKGRLENASPSGAGSGGHLASKWKIKKGAHKRIITNTKKVKGKGGTSVPLVNILEYSTKHGHPFVDSTIAGCANDVRRIFEENIDLK